MREEPFTTKKALRKACKISGNFEMSHHVFVVAFDMQKAKKSPARGGAMIRERIR